MLYSRRRHVSNSVALLGVVIALLSVLSPLIAVRTVSASVYSEQVAVDRLKSYDALTILKMCFVPEPGNNNSEMHLVINAGSANSMGAWTIKDTDGADLTNPNLINQTPTAKDRKIQVPAYYDIENDNNLESNQVTCSKFFNSYGTYMGISDPVKYLEDAGFTFDGEAIATFHGCQIAGTPSQIAQRSTDEYYCLRQATGTRLGISTTSPPAWDDQMSYLQKKLILDAKGAGTQPGGCYVHWSSNTANSASFSINDWIRNEVGRSGDDGILGTQANPTIIQIADNDGIPTKQVGNIAASEGGDGGSGWSKRVYVGPGVANTTEPRLRATTEKCQDLATDLGLTTPRYVAWAKENTSSNNESSSTPSDTAESVGDSCPIESGGMRWLECSIFFALQGTADKLRDQLSQYLYITPEIFNADTQKSANVFRNIGMALVVIAGLFMVISQALGLDLLDAYTIRKLLPKLGIALIGMALAWPLLKLALTLTNDIGQMIYSILMGLAAQTDPSVSSADEGTRMGSAFWFLTATGGVGLAIGTLGFLSLFGTIILALLIGVLVLTIRQLVIFMLIIMAPLAIAAYVFPGGEKLWKFWKTTLITTLLMYPLIMGFIGAGAAMSYIMPKENLSDGTTSMSLLAIMVYFAPFFMLPFAFKLAGGLMTTIFSFANDKNRGMFDRLKKYRGEKAGKNIGAMKVGNRFRNTSALGRGFNKATRTAANLPSAGLNPAAWRRRYGSNEAQHTYDEAESLFKNQDFMSGAGDDNINWAVMHGGREGMNGVRRELENRGYSGQRLSAAMGTAERMLKSGSTEAVITAATMQQVLTGSGYKDNGEMLNEIATASGGNRVLATRMLGTMRSLAKQAGRNDLNGRFGEMNTVLMDELDGRDRGLRREDRAAAQSVEKLNISAFSNTDLATLARDRPESTVNITESLKSHIKALTDESTATADPTRKAEIEGEIGQLTAQLQNYTEAAREYGALQRAHTVHLANEEVSNADVQGPRLENGQMSRPSREDEYQAHLSKYSDKQAGLRGGALDPNMRREEPAPEGRPGG